jgi:hypothetical protein
MENVGIFYVHLVYVMAIWNIILHFYFGYILWYNFPALVCCIKKSGSPDLKQSCLVFLCANGKWETYTKWPQTRYTKRRQVICTKWPWNIPNGHKIYQHFPFKGPTKFAQIGMFGMKINHLATLTWSVQPAAVVWFGKLSWKMASRNVRLHLPTFNAYFVIPQLIVCFGETEPAWVKLKYDRGADSIKLKWSRFRVCRAGLPDFSL